MKKMAMVLFVGLFLSNGYSMDSDSDDEGCSFVSGQRERRFYQDQLSGIENDGDVMEHVTEDDYLWDGYLETTFDLQRVKDRKKRAFLYNHRRGLEAILLNTKYAKLLRHIPEPGNTAFNDGLDPSDLRHTIEGRLHQNPSRHVYFSDGRLHVQINGRVRYEELEESRV